MAFFDFLKQSRRESAQNLSIQKLVSDAVQKSFNLKSPGPLQKFAADLLGVESTSVSKPYQQSIWVYACINIWTRVSTIPLQLLDSKGNEITGGPEKFLLDSPNSSMTTSEFVEYLILSLGTSGQYFVLREDGQNIEPNKLPKYFTVVAPWCMSLVDGDVDKKTGKVITWTLSTGTGESRKIPVAGVITSMLPNPYRAHIGLSPLEAIRLTVDGDYAARMHNKWLMERHGRISGIVSFQDVVGKDRLSQMADMWREKYEGADNSGKTGFLDSGAKYQQLTLSSKDLDWLEGQKLSREEICAAFQVPPCNAGILDKATYSNFDQSSKTLWDDTLIPIGRRIENSLNKYVFGPATSNKLKVKFDFVNNVKILQANENEKIERYVKLVQNFVSPAQAAMITGLKLGKPDPSHDIVWGGIQLVPVSDILNPPEYPTSPVPAPAPKTIDAEEVKKSLPPAGADSPNQANTITELSKEIRQARGRSIIRQAAGYERQMRQTMKRYFNDQHKTVADNMSKVTSYLKAQEAKGVILKIKQTPDEMADMMLKGRDWNKEILKRCGPILRSVGILSAKNVLVELGKPKTEFREDTLVSFWKAQETLLQKVNDTTRKGLVDASRTMIDTLVSGESPEVAANTLKTEVDAEFGRTAASRAICIARTETLRAVNGARFEEMSDVGIEAHEWLAVMDDAVRESHASIDREKVRIGEKFSIGVAYPLDPLGDKGETINCRCTTVAVFK